jgi:ATP-dependent 26S proteasome regulatory subunit
LRPGRFDRKYPFDLPELPERAAYVAQWNETLRPALRLSPEVISFVAETTEGFSFAYLKELFLSAMMRWIGLPEAGAMDGVMREQVEVLREQMASIEELPSDPGYGEQMIPAGPMHRGPYGRRFGPIQHGPGPGEVPM